MESRGARARRVGWLVGCVVAASALVAVQLLPYLTLFAHNERRAGLGFEEAQHWAFQPMRLVELVVPGAFGDVDRAGSWFAYALDNEGGDVDRWPWMTTPYAGSVTLLFAFAAWGASGTRRRFAAFFAGVAAFATMLAFGRATPLFTVWFHVVPLASAFRYPAKYFMATALALPLLGAIGLDALLAGKARARRGAFVGAAVIAATAATFAAFASTIARRALALPSSVVPLAADVMTETAVLALLVPLVATIAVGVVHRVKSASEPAKRGLLLAAALLGVGDLWWNVVRPVPVASASFYTRTPSWVGRVLADAGAGDEPPRVYWDIGDVDLAGPSSPLDRVEAARAELDAAMPDTSLLFGLTPMNLYTMTETDGDRRFWATAPAHLRAVLDAYGVRVVVRDRREPLERGPDALVPIVELPRSGVTVLVNPRALPTVYFASIGFPARSVDDAVAHLEDPRVRSGAAVMLEAALPAAPPTAALPETAACRREPSPGGDGDTLRARCDAPHEGWAVFSTADEWGWRASVDGAAAAIVRANGRGMAVRVGPGGHDVVLRYREPTYGAGAALSLFTLLALGAAFARERQIDRRARA